MPIQRVVSQFITISHRVLPLFAMSLVFGVPLGLTMPAVSAAASLVPTQPGLVNSLSLEPREIAAISVPGAEVVSYDRATQRFWVAMSDGLRIVERAGEDWQVKSVATPAHGSITHVQVDPADRGFVVAGLLPRDPRSPVSVLVFDARSAALIATWPAGHGPDCVTVTPCGMYIVSADEGQPARLPDGGIFDPPASITRIDLRGITGIDQIAALDADRIVTAIPDRDWVLAELAREPSIRIHPDNAASPDLDLEPEYIAVIGDTAWITLQENNALARFDIPSATWLGLIAIPSITNTIDASDRDGINISTPVRCMPMPDQVAILGTPDDPIIFFPGEGDTRAELGEPGPLPDHARHRALVRAGRAAANPALDRLKVCAFAGDTTNDGIIDTPHAFGSRALHRYRPVTNEWLDTGSLMEQTIAKHSPERFNANGGCTDSMDTRSDDRGPEPEGIAIGHINNQPIIFVSIERPGGIMAFDTDLKLLAYDMGAARGHIAPEGMVFVPGDASPVGVPILAVGYEVSGTLVIYEIVQRSGAE